MKLLTPGSKETTGAALCLCLRVCSMGPVVRENNRGNETEF